MPAIKILIQFFVLFNRPNTNWIFKFFIPDQRLKISSIEYYRTRESVKNCGGKNFLFSFKNKQTSIENKENFENILALSISKKKFRKKSTDKNGILNKFFLKWKSTFAKLLNKFKKNTLFVGWFWKYSA